MHVVSAAGEMGPIHFVLRGKITISQGSARWQRVARTFGRYFTTQLCGYFEREGGWCRQGKCQGLGIQVYTSRPGPHFKWTESTRHVRCVQVSYEPGGIAVI